MRGPVGPRHALRSSVQTGPHLISRPLEPHLLVEDANSAIEGVTDELSFAAYDSGKPNTNSAIAHHLHNIDNPPLGHEQIGGAWRGQTQHERRRCSPVRAFGHRLRRHTQRTTVSGRVPKDPTSSNLRRLTLGPLNRSRGQREGLNELLRRWIKAPAKTPNHPRNRRTDLPQPAPVPPDWQTRQFVDVWTDNERRKTLPQLIHRNLLPHIEALMEVVGDHRQLKLAYQYPLHKTNYENENGRPEGARRLIILIISIRPASAEHSWLACWSDS